MFFLLMINDIYKKKKKKKQRKYKMYFNPLQGKQNQKKRGHNQKSRV